MGIVSQIHQEFTIFQRKRDNMKSHMSLQEAIKFFGIPKEYQNAMLENATMLPIEMRELGQMWLNATEKPSLYLEGIPGSGKTYFAYALLRGLFEFDQRGIIFVTSRDLDDELLRNFEENQELSAIRKYQEVDFLFIDDIGTERRCERIIRQYGTIIDYRCANKMTTIYTSNLSIERLRENLGDRICSRVAVSNQIGFPDKDLRAQIALPSIT